jgi:translation initiation factor IF-1
MKDNDRDRMIVEGVVSKVLGNGKFIVKVETHDVLCTLSGKIRENNIRVLLGDLCTLELGKFDPCMGRIIFRNKG